MPELNCKEKTLNHSKGLFYFSSHSFFANGHTCPKNRYIYNDYQQVKLIKWFENRTILKIKKINVSGWFEFQKKPFIKSQIDYSDMRCGNKLFF